MALEKAVIIANESLKELSDVQVAAIETLSKNDETIVIGSRIGELHGSYDKDILDTSGIEKNQGEKSYDYAKRVIGSFKESAGKAEGLATEIKGFKTEISTLTQKIADGKGNEVVAQKLKDNKDKLVELQGLYDTDKKAWETKEGEFATKMNTQNVNHAFSAIQLKFKTEYPESVQKTLTNAARETVLSKYKPDFIDDGKGGKAMVFRDDKGIIQNNAENKLNPYTAEELIKLQLKDVLDAGRKAAGGGAGGGAAGADDVNITDIGSAKNQVEADEIIVKHLLKSGLTRGSQEFAEKKKELRDKSQVTKLPIR